MKELHQKIRDVQKENDELLSKLAKKERECDVKTEEKVSFELCCVFQCELTIDYSQEQFVAIMSIF